MTENEEPGQLVEFEKMVQRFLEMFEIRMLLCLQIYT